MSHAICGTAKSLPLGEAMAEIRDAVDSLADAVLRRKSGFEARERNATQSLQIQLHREPTLCWLDMQKLLNVAYRALGAPGDFGYHTPEGMAMQWLYDAWMLASRAWQAERAVATKVTEPTLA